MIERPGDANTRYGRLGRVHEIYNLWLFAGADFEARPGASPAPGAGEANALGFPSYRAATSVENHSP